METLYRSIENYLSTQEGIKDFSLYECECGKKYKIQINFTSGTSYLFGINNLEDLKNSL